MQVLPDADSLPVNNSTPTQAIRSIGTQLLSNAMQHYLYLFVETMTGVFALLGPFSNMANILVFRRLGFASVSNISLTFLSLFDLATSVLIASIMLSRTKFFELTIAVAGDAIAILVGPVFYSSSAISSWTTAVISLERCCCIMFPLKVKVIFTRRTVVILLMVMLLYNGQVVVYLVLLSYSIPTVVCLFLVTVGTILLVVKLQESTEFRKTSTATVRNRPEKISTKEKTLARSIIGICLIYIVCMSPNVLVFVIGAVFPPFNFLNPVYGNLASFALFVGIFFQSVSASINVFVYIRMMKMYRATLKKMFYCCEKNK